MLKTALLENIISDFPANVNFTVCGVNKTITSKTLEYNGNAHEQLLLFVKTGKGACVFADDSIPLYRGVVLYISDHCNYQITDIIHDHLDIIYIRFHMNLVSDQQRLGMTPPFYSYFMPDDILKTGIMFHNLYFTIRDDTLPEIEFAYINSFIINQLIELYKNEKTNSHSQIDERVIEAKRMIETNKHKNISLHEISMQIGISQRYLRQLFTIQYGVSPKQYHLKVRMEFSRFLLLEKNFSVKKTAIEIGYSDIYIFSRQYKSYFGYPPSHTTD